MKAEKDKLIRDYKVYSETELKSLEVIMLVMATNVEAALIDAGAIPEKDYTMLDLFTLGQPFALEMYKRNYKDISFLTESRYP